MWKLTISNDKMYTFFYCFYAMKTAEYIKKTRPGVKIYCKYEKE